MSALGDKQTLQSHVPLKKPTHRVVVGKFVERLCQSLNSLYLNLQMCQRMHSSTVKTHVCRLAEESDMFVLYTGLSGEKTMKGSI